MNIGNISDIKGISFINVNEGYISGSQSRILKTSNGGLNWENQNSGVSQLAVLGRMAFINQNTGYITGGAYLRTTNGGLNWINDGNSGGFDVSYPEFHAGYRVGGSGIILKSTDGGIVWITQSGNVAENLNTIHFIDPNNGFAAGDGGSVTRTTNGGTNWVPQTRLTNNNLRSVFFTDADNGYISGDFGTLIKTTNGGLVFISYNTFSSPEDFKLHQNFPNPFNSSTIIKYDIKKQGNVEMKLYDITGKFVKTLVQEVQEQGSYSILFSPASNDLQLQSGVYFYTLKFDSKNILTKKLLYIK
ncbi:MAG: T9SS type A sorting domain-containing protein [Ignavibacteria bacterium]|nr:T9SS type A sorting domain-containing protein [Ignavibacteria bacterium]